MNINPLEANRSIGAILVDTGRLGLDDVERILHMQRERGIRFGDAAVELGLLTIADIQFALARQYDYPYLLPGQGEVSEELVAAYEPFSHKVEALRALRSNLMVRWLTGANEQRILAVVSPGRGDGRSYLAANLAVVFSQLGERTLLIDADLRRPRQHLLFNLDDRSGLSTILSHRAQADEIKRIPSFVDLSVLCAGPVPPNPQELLGRPAFAGLLQDMAKDFDVILIDTPPTNDFADVQTIALRARGALLLARVRQTRTSDLRNLAATLAQSGVTVVGSVLNESVIEKIKR
jgi:chain length determinant protein tyrosine kinase EpsG